MSTPYASPDSQFEDLQKRCSSHAPSIVPEGPPTSIQTRSEAIEAYTWLLASLCHNGAGPEDPVTLDPVTTFGSGPKEWPKVLWQAVRTWDGEALAEDHPALKAADRLAEYLDFKITDTDLDSVQDLQHTREALRSLQQAMSTP
jgi:hypothetical protein